MVNQLDSCLEDLSAFPEDSIELYVEMEECDLHFLDAITKGYDGIANVRREYRVVDGEKQFLVYTSPGMLDFTLNKIRSLRRYMYIGKIVVSEDIHDS